MNYFVYFESDMVGVLGVFWFLKKIIIALWPLTFLGVTFDIFNLNFAVSFCCCCRIRTYLTDLNDYFWS